VGLFGNDRQHGPGGNPMITPRRRFTSARMGERSDSKKAVTAETLVQLGAERLTNIPLQLAEEQPTIKRRLRLELAGEAGAEITAAEIGSASRRSRRTARRPCRMRCEWLRQWLHRR
jgi:hypothetical protein